MIAGLLVAGRRKRGRSKGRVHVRLWFSKEIWFGKDRLVFAVIRIRKAEGEDAAKTD